MKPPHSNETPVLKEAEISDLSGSSSDEEDLPDQFEKLTTSEHLLNQVLKENYETNSKWGRLTDPFYDAIEDKRENNRLATELRKGNVDINPSKKKVLAYPVNVNGIMSDKTDDLILNALNHSISNVLGSLKKPKKISPELQNLLVPKGSDISFLFGSRLPSNKKDKGYKEFEKWKKKCKLNNKQVMQLQNQVTSIINHTSKINDLVSVLASKKSINVRSTLKDLKIRHPYDLVYFCIVLTQRVKSKYIPKVLVYEIVLGLKWAIKNSSEKKKIELYEHVLNLVETEVKISPEEISLQYPEGISYPVITDTMKNKGDTVVLKDCQVEMINELNKTMKLFEKFVVEGQKPIKPQRLAITTGFATGKSTLASLIPTQKMQEINSKIAIKDNHGVVLYVMPSPMTAADFAVISEKIGAVWLARDGVMIPMFSCCPIIKTRSRRRPEIPDRWAEKRGGLNKSLPIIEQMKQLIDYRGTGQKYKRDHYVMPTTMFMDPKTAVEVLANQEQWYERFGFRFLPVVDEVLATGDVEVEKNAYIDAMAAIVHNFGSFGVVISATLTERQMKESNIFNECDIYIVSGGESCSSFSLMFNHEGKSLQPLQGLDIKNFDEFMKDISSTILRCFTPKVFSKLKSSYQMISGKKHESLTYDDVSTASSFLLATKRLLEAIRSYSKEDQEKAAEICKTQVQFPEIELKGTASKITLTTTNPLPHILEIIKNPATPEKLENLFASYGKSVKAEIVELKGKKAQVAREKNSDQMFESSDAIAEKIAQKEQELKDEQNWRVTLQSQFGSVNVSREWVDKYAHLDPKLFALLLCGLELTFNNRELDKAIAEVKPKPFVIIDSIAGMYGRNVPTCVRVDILGDGIGWETIAQAAARAGREKSDTGIVSLYIDEGVLKSDPGKRSIVKLQESIDKLLCEDNDISI